jgi:uncharacterized protein
MKHAAARVKRKTIGKGAKRTAPRRRITGRVKTAAPKPRRPDRRNTVAKVKVVKSSRASAPKKTAARKPRLKVVSRRSKLRQPATPPADVAPTTAPAKQSRRTRILPVMESKPVKLRPVTTRRKAARRSPGLKVPAILLEGDEPESSTVSGPGEKFALGPKTPTEHFPAEAARLPASYGTERLFLTARDPHWLYAHWDFNTTTQFRHNSKSADRHLILRMYEGGFGSPPATEIHVHPESRHWFAHVERAGQEYVAELGYYQTGHQWKSLAASAPMRTPPEKVSTDSTVEFATIPLDLPFETMLALLQESGEAGSERDQPLARALKGLRARRVRELPASERVTEWTPAQERALAEFFAAHQEGMASTSSHEIGELLRGQPESEDLPAGTTEFELSSFFGGESVFSPLGGGENVGKDFWFNVNAELIIYGATEPDATVTLGGKQIGLRPDGSFRFQFALPDGQHELPIVATSADGTDGRAAELKFTRTTESLGDVGAHPPDPALKPPETENI